MTTESDVATDRTRGSDVDRVRRAVLSLPDNDQTVIVLRYYAGMSFEEIGSITGCRPDAARKRLSRAIEAMRSRLDLGTTGGRSAS